MPFNQTETPYGLGNPVGFSLKPLDTAAKAVFKGFLDKC